MERFEEVFRFLPARIRNALINDERVMNCCRGKGLNEIRLRVNQAVILMFGRSELFCNEIITMQEDIQQCLQFISDYSLYAHEEDVGNGFITLKGGHRAGLMGQGVIQNGKVVNQKNIGFINIRVAYEVKGCADNVMDFLADKDFENTLIISPPAKGKTTLLRDVIRQFSYGYKGRSYKIGVVDERSEIAACFAGIPQNDVGPRTDVIYQVPKADGMIMLLRSMSPEIIAVDELAGKEDALAVRELIGCGCKVIATVHGYNRECIERQPYIGELIGEFGFRRIITLGCNTEGGWIQSKEVV